MATLSPKRYASFSSFEEADRGSVETCRAYAATLGVGYPILATSYTGPTRPAQWDSDPVYYATLRLTEPVETKVVGEYTLEVTPEMESLPAGDDVVRSGVELDADTWPVDVQAVEMAL